MTKKLITSILLLFFSVPAYPCTTFLINEGGQLIFGKNYDFMTGYGYVFVNKRGMEKTAFTKDSNPAKWTSRYGSITFNQFGREFPSGGMNEAGLVIELMWLDGTQYPVPDDRANVGGVLQWIQYQLDNHSTIEEIIESDKKIRINQNSVPLHYFAADKNGNAVTIEFLDGKLIYHTGSDLKMKVLTNDKYESSIDYLKNFEGFGGDASVPPTASSLDRFAKACSMISRYNYTNGINAVDFGFSVLDSVSQGEFTQWSIIYDIVNSNVYFRTGESRGIRNIDMTAIDFGCAAPVVMLDINIAKEGNVNEHFIVYEYETNRELIENAYNNVPFLKDVKDEDKDEAALYPQTTHCDERSENKIKSKNMEPTTIVGIVFLLASLAVILYFRRRR